MYSCELYRQVYSLFPKINANAIIATLNGIGVHQWNILASAWTDSILKVKVTLLDLPRCNTTQKLTEMLLPLEIIHCCYFNYSDYTRSQDVSLAIVLTSFLPQHTASTLDSRWYHLPLAFLLFM